MVIDLRALIRDAISTEWHRRIAEQTVDSPDGHVDALTNAVMDRLTQTHEVTSYADLARGERVYLDEHGAQHAEPIDPEIWMTTENINRAKHP